MVEGEDPVSEGGFVGGAEGEEEFEEAGGVEGFGDVEVAEGVTPLGGDEIGVGFVEEAEGFAARWLPAFSRPHPRVVERCLHFH